jgi:hypothetical protein
VAGGHPWPGTDVPVEANMTSGDKHGARRDDALKHDTEDLVRSGRGTHAEEWRDPEPPGEDQPDADLAPNTTLAGGTPAGLSEADVEGRSELAQNLRDVTWPASRTVLRDALERGHAPDRMLELVDALPEGRLFTSVAEVWVAAGGGAERPRRGGEQG